MRLSNASLRSSAPDSTGPQPCGSGAAVVPVHHGPPVPFPGADVIRTGPRSPTETVAKR